MHKRLRSLAGWCVWATCLGSLLAWDASAASVWRRTTGGFWWDPDNWTSPTAPTLATGGVYITNGTSKVVLVDAATPSSNLFINSLNVWAPTNTTNTLLLADMGPGNPLVVSNQTLAVAARGAIVVTNSSLVVTGSFVSFNVWAGNVTLDSGSIVAREAPPTPQVTVITRIGRTNAATLTLNGGTFDCSSLLIGESPGVQFARSRGTIRLTGGELRCAGEFSVADGVGCTGVVEVAGGELRVANNLTNISRIGDHGFGQMTVFSNGNVFLGNLSVARHNGASGALTILPGGSVFGSDDFNIGRFPLATGLVVVAGGQLLLTNNPLWVGREGVGQLVLSNGLVQVGALLVGTEPTNTVHGTVAMQGGTFLVTDTTNTATLAVGAGSMTFQDGAITADRLVLTNAAGSFLFHGGTLASKDTTVSNGAPFVVGDGVSPATFELLGGVHRFADGLVISANATLSGCGTIVGSVVNHGTIDTNCTSVGTAPSITQQPRSQTVLPGTNVTFTVAAAGTEPLSYQWRFGVPGAGGGNLAGATSATLVVSNVSAANLGNYRVVVSNAAGAATSDVATLRVLIAPVITNVLSSSNTLSLSFPTLKLLNYTVERKDGLEAISWTPLETRPGDGTLQTVVDPAVTAAVRLYRVRVD